MDPGVDLVLENPYKKANIFSKLTYMWTIDLFRKGVKQGLQVMDLYKTLSANKSERLGNKLEINWNKEVKIAKLKNREPSLRKAISDTFFWECLMQGILQFIQCVVVKTSVPVILGYLIKMLNDSHQTEDSRLKMHITAALLPIASLIVSFMYQHLNFGTSIIGMRVRIAVSSLVYRKLLRLNKKSLGQTEAGQIVNLLSNDVNRFDFLAPVLNFLWISPLQIVVVTYFIWDLVGIACLSGIIVMIIFTLPVQLYLGKLTTALRSKIATRTDKRVRLMNETISGIQVIKMYAWEKPFELMVAAIRATEIKVLTASAYIRSIYLSCIVFVQHTTLFLTILTYVLLGNAITADKVFAMSSFFSLLQYTSAIFLPMAISLGAEAIISVKRLQTFLMLEEKCDVVVNNTYDKKIILSDIQARWSTGNKHLTLKGIHLEIPSGALCAIIGPVGSGKSSILHLLLEELNPETGNVTVGGELSYSSQEPWLFASTVRNNILFGQAYDAHLYHRVTEACALFPDFDKLPQRDKTMVGDRGVSLSGGQRARINLARAIYRSADIYLLDDPLSAVDTHVGKQLFEECIMNYLKGKTRVLVTHQLQFLPKADIIVVINEGKIEAQGTYDELSNSNLDFTKMLLSADESAKKEQVTTKLLERRFSTNNVTSVQIEIVGKSEYNDEKIKLSGLSAWKEYTKAAGNWFTLIIVALLAVSSQVVYSGTDYFLSFWTSQEQLRLKNHSVLTNIEILSSVFYKTNGTIQQTIEVSTSDYNRYETNQTSVDEPVYSHLAMYIYLALNILIIILTLVRTFACFKVCMVASKNLHLTMFNSLLMAPMRFFDTNPSGSILNRFSKDMGAVDEILPRVLIETIQIVLQVVGILVITTISNIYMIIAIVIFGCLLTTVRKWYIKNCKVIKQIEGITKSPVFSHLNSSLNGITTIRASHMEAKLIEEFDKHQDLHTSAWYLIVTSMVSFGLWLDVICIIFTTCVIFSFILLSQYGDVSESVVGLAVSQSLILSAILQYGMRQSAEVVNQMTSVERVLHYSTLDKEGPFETIKEIDIPANWPRSGKVKFHNIYLKYTQDGASVLQDINVLMNPGEKIGIVGRTGAGKSSLISALFRLAPTEGNIYIDGINTTSISLHDLREKMSTIPQEPVLFSATLRYNLDPFGKFGDAELWNALEEVELKESISTLDFMVEERGANISVGQRQLLCLARAILRKNKILVLDEATANVDARTDALIQTTIRKKFVDCTVLTIAHRLNTIMDSDKVLVMDAGRIVEYDHPYTLLQNSNGYFTKMVEQTGPTMSTILHQIAHGAYNKQQILEKIISVHIEEEAIAPISICPRGITNISEERILEEDEHLAEKFEMVENTNQYSDLSQYKITKF